MNLRDFTELLKGCRPVKDNDGNIVIQSILNMQIVCLTTDAEYSLDERFANPLNALVAGNRSYGEINFDNNENKDVIVPTQMAVLTKQSAQNHGMVKAGYISKNTSATFHDAGCVQGSQGGTFRGTSEFRFLPVTMREMLFDKVGQTSGHGNIYPAIEKLGRDTNSNTGQYIDKYFSKYDKKLDEFIAHFERPKNLIGIVVLIDGEIVAIDKFPSFTYAEQVWDLMVRDCYGALAIISELKNNKSRKTFTDNYVEFKNRSRKEYSAVEILEKVLKKTKDKMNADVSEKIRELLELTFDVSLDTEGQSTSTGAPKSYMLKDNNNGYVGQLISETDYHHLVSIVKRENFDPNALRVLNELKDKANNQSQFSWD